MPLLGVLPGTGGLTRLVDKRKVRRDLADVFCTTRRGHQGQAREGLGPRRSRRVAHEVGRGGRRARARRSPRSSTVDARPGVRAAAARAEDHGRRRSRTSTSSSTSIARRAPATLDRARRPTARRHVRRAPTRAVDACARSASSTTRCSACASTTRTSASSRSARSGDARARARVRRGAREGDHWLRARGPPAPAPRAQAPRQHRAQLLRGRRRRRLVLRRLAARARARRRPLLHADRRRREDRACRPSRREQRLLHDVERALAARRALLGEPARVAEGPRARRRGPDPDARRPRSSASRRSRADDIDFDDELRIAIEERASLSPDALTGMEAIAALRRPRDDGDQDLRPPLGLAELDLHARQRRPASTARSRCTASPSGPQFQWKRT